MRLKCIKLAGFKSFVDPTTVSFPGNLTAIVGPNGCGKSNVIDAVRWVMGESSAKQLRGESLTDVIFNGSNTRKPTGQASIELVFENADGRIGGQYASFGEIAVRRQVTREGQSQYFLNHTRCRRRDIQDLFLGTGLGPRSYSIIEQGMISNLIEARPEELRSYLEEAAGISRYKERRRETENRIRHTRDNLDRLNDLREELERQLARLQRQARAAEKYRELKAEERQRRAELLALRWRQLSAEVERHQGRVRELDRAQEALRAERQRLVTEQEKVREGHVALTDATDAVQQRFYALGADIARLEENLRARQQRQRQLEADREAARRRSEEAVRHLQADRQRVETLERDLAEIEPERSRLEAGIEQARADQEAAEQAVQAWQQEWDQFNEAAAEPQRQVEVERSRMTQLEQSLQRTRQRLERLAGDAETVRAESGEADLEGLAEQLATLDEAMAHAEDELAGLAEQIASARGALANEERELAEARSALQQRSGRRASLDALQEAALGRTDSATRTFLEERGLDRRPRLAERLQVSSGWETAVEAALGDALQAVVVEVLDAPAEAAMALEQADLTLFEGQRGGGATASADDLGRIPLASLVQSEHDLDSLLVGKWAVESLALALPLRERMAADETLVTRDGVLLGRHWLRLTRGDTAGRGVLRRAQEIEALDAELDSIRSRIDTGESRVSHWRTELGRLEQLRQGHQQQLSELGRQHGALRAERSAAQARMEAAAARQQRLERERGELEAQLSQEQQQFDQARAARETAEARVAEFAARRDTYLSQRDAARATLQQTRERLQSQRDQAHQLELRRQQLNHQLTTTRAAVTRLLDEQETLAEQLETLAETLAEEAEPGTSLREDLDAALARRVEVEAELVAARERQQASEQSQRELEQRRVVQEERIQAQQQELEAARMARQEVLVRRETLDEQLREDGFKAEGVLATLPEDASIQAWQADLEQIEARIGRLGPINLAAIEEYDHEQERKVYLDAQHEDLTEALTTLEEAIRKIDRETRARFRETFDQVNAGLQALFPKVFGGGSAYLELTGEDLLDTGVAIMARPPGKRNASIHLLSGGEKALTAIALVFSIFQLNPAPFCMLDEVDAPLDDANVGRFCKLVTEMSRDVQFIYITHNKISMEMGERLMGVTMQEPGVSRLVAVDVEQAAAMVAG